MDLQEPGIKKPNRIGLSRWWNYALELVFPRNCPLCNRALEENDPGCICPVCLTFFKRIQPPMCHSCGRPVHGEVHGKFVCTQCQGKRLHYDRALSACMADARMLDVIHRFKYQQELFFAPHLGDLIVACGREHLEWSGVDAIVPVPLHPVKQRKRQFNQAGILADALHAAFDVLIWDDNLRRVIDTPSQTFLNADQRQKNLRDAFTIRKPDLLKGKCLVLVDDVYTTGSTSNACAKVLKSAGATRILVLTLARAF